MSDVSGTTPEEPVVPADAALPDEAAIPPADAVIPPPPPETPIPDGLLNPPTPPVIPDAEAVIPPPPPEPLRRSDRPRRTPAVLEQEPPAAAADDWSQPTVAPEVPTSGNYRVLTAVIFVFLFLLLIAAVAVIVYLLNTTGLPFAGVDPAAVPLALRL